MQKGELHPNGKWEADVCERCNQFLGWITEYGYHIGLFHHNPECLKELKIMTKDNEEKYQGCNHHSFSGSMTGTSGNAVCGTPRVGPGNGEYCQCGAFNQFKEVFVIGIKDHLESDPMGGHSHRAIESTEHLPAKACKVCGIISLKLS